MSQANTSSNNPRIKYADRIKRSGHDTSRTNRFSKNSNPRQDTQATKKKKQETINRLSLPVGVEPDDQDPLKKNYNDLVQKNPHVDTVQRWLGKAGNGLNTAGGATKEIFGSLGGISKLGLKKSTSNPLATTIIAGGGSALAGLFSIRSLINTFKIWNDPKTGNWFVSALKTIIQGGLAIGLGAPFLGKGHKSPFLKKVDGEEVVELKAILGGVGAWALVSIYENLEKLPIFKRIKPLVDIKKDVDSGIKDLTTSEGVTQQGIGGGAGLPPGLGQAA